MPRTIPWEHRKYVNTCTSVNILTMLLLHCQQNQQFLCNFSSSHIEGALKSGISLMLNGDMSMGKEVILDSIHSRTNQQKTDGGLIDCIGTEYGQFMQHLRRVWKMFISLRCNSMHCPKPLTKRYPSSLSLVPVSVKPFCSQLNTLFPNVGDESGYCGQEFHNDPPDDAFSCQQERSSSSGCEYYCECVGSLTVQVSQFLSKTPWILPFQIDSYGPTDLQCISTTVPDTIRVYSKVYKLAGYTMIKDNHLTSVVYWKNKKLLYNGFGVTDEVRLRKVCNSDFLDQKGSYLYFLLQ